jgi:UPF0716 protein FxsA
MDRRPRLLSMVHLDTVTRVLFVLLLASLVIIADGYVLILVSRYLGIYLLLAAEATTGLIAVMMILSSYRHTVTLVRESVRQDRYPGVEFRSLSCLWVGAACLIVPGFVTDAIGIAALLPPLRWGIGYWIERRGRNGFEELYEYLKLEE